jgi:Ser/Thr protein kinase RdoA (MazF antagonist)
MSDALHPYATLTPDAVMDALSSIGLWGDGRLTALSSYENRVYQIGLDEPFEGHAQVVAKFYRPDRWSEDAILEEHAFAAELAAAEVPAVAPLVVQGRTLHQHAGFAFSVSPRRGGRTPELDDAEVLEWIGRFLARIHVVGEAAPFQHRPTLDLASFAIEPRDWLLAHDAIPLGDCHPGNILWTPDQGPHFVDLDDARMGPAVQDLWMLQSGDRVQRQRQLGALIDGYEQFREFDRRELALIEPLRTLRLIHYSAWLARRWDDPAFPRAFPWFGSSDYWKGQCQMLEDQLEAMEEPPLVV